MKGDELHEVNDELVPAGNVKKRPENGGCAGCILHPAVNLLCLLISLYPAILLRCWAAVHRHSLTPLPHFICHARLFLACLFSVLSYSGPSSLGAGPVIHPASPRSQLREQDCSCGSEVVMTKGVRRRLLDVGKRGADLVFVGWIGRGETITL